MANDTDPSRLLDSMAEGLYVSTRPGDLPLESAAEDITGFSADEVTDASAAITC